MFNWVKSIGALWIAYKDLKIKISHAYTGDFYEPIGRLWRQKYSKIVAGQDMLG